MFWSPGPSSACRPTARYSTTHSMLSVCLRQRLLASLPRSVGPNRDLAVQCTSFPSLVFTQVCCGGTGEDLEAFLRRKDRVWLNTLLEPQGPFVDMFRHFQPAR